jgi:hypothetical protein
MAHQVIDANDVEPSHGVFRSLTAPLGVSAFKVHIYQTRFLSPQPLIHVYGWQSWTH